MSNLPVGVLLAAGQSRRFGANKLLHPVLDDTPMLFVTAKTLASVLPGSIIVINQELAAYTTQLEELGLKVVINENSKTGIGSSISCGIRVSEESHENISGWLILLADMPYIKPDTILLLAEKIKNGADIVAPVFEQQRGHPVGFSHRYLSELIALNEDVGARNIINSHQNNLELVTVSDDGVIKDIDYASELA
jgi:molybdenum cofactor cytidylyltransferase